MSFKMCLGGAAVDVEEGLESESVSGGAPEGEEHRDAGGAFEFQAAILIGANKNFVIDEFYGGVERFAAKWQVQLLFFLEANPAFKLSDRLFQLGAEFSGKVDGAGGVIAGRTQAVDEVDDEP